MNAAQTKLGKKKRASRKKRSTKSNTRATATKRKADQTPLAPRAVGLEQRIEGVLHSNISETFPPASIAKTLAVNPKAVILALGRMTKKNKAEKTEGGYRAVGKVGEMPKAG